MIQTIRTWLIQLVSVAFIATLVEILTPKCGVKKLVRFACGLLFILTVFRPFLQGVHFSGMADYSEWESQIKTLTEEYEAENRKSWTSLIEEEIRTYIAVRAEEIGFPCEIIVSVAERDGVPTVSTVEIRAKTYNAALAAYMEENLGILPQQQIWKGT